MRVDHPDSSLDGKGALIDTDLGNRGVGNIGDGIGVRTPVSDRNASIGHGIWQSRGNVAELLRRHDFTTGLVQDAERHDDR